MNGVLLLGEDLRARFHDHLDEYGYLIHVRPAASIDAIASAVIELKHRGAEAICAIGVGGPATALIEAATVLPQLDAIALFAARLPTTRVHYERMRVHIQVHRAEHGKAMTAADVERLSREAETVIVLDWEYATTNDRFVVEPRSERDDLHATVALDRVRDFLATSLPAPAA